MEQNVYSKVELAQVGSAIRTVLAAMDRQDLKAGPAAKSFLAGALWVLDSLATGRQPDLSDLA